jgi:anti-anti-sigma regulatory factor
MGDIAVLALDGGQWNDKDALELKRTIRRLRHTGFSKVVLDLGCLRCLNRSEIPFLIASLKTLHEEGLDILICT